jgi:hypothetical protein
MVLKVSGYGMSTLNLFIFFALNRNIRDSQTTISPDSSHRGGFRQGIKGIN